MKTILRTLLFPLLFVNMVAIGHADPVLSPQGNAIVKACDLPDMSRIPPFSAQSNYLSLAGFLNLKIHEHSGAWLSANDRAAAIGEQVVNNLAEMHQAKEGTADR